jgi:arylformamidase
MASLDYEAEYNNSARVPEFPEIAARWKAVSAAYREVARADLDQPYGPGERHRFDLFYAGVADASLLVYVHGGYWQSGDRSLYGFVAQAFNDAGLDVAIPSYTLCPEASVLDIVDDLRFCLAQLWRTTRIRPLVIGHSAGGHLTAAMLATRWETVAGVPGDLVRGGVAISGVFDLEPLVRTSINGALGLDTSAARTASPRFWPSPAKGRALVAAVGAEESPEFRRQSRELADHWGAAGVRTEYAEIEGANHFSVVEELARPGSALNERVLTFTEELRGRVLRT